MCSIMLFPLDLSTSNKKQKREHVRACKIECWVRWWGRKRKRREFALLRDKECEGMTAEERQAWMDSKKEESKY